MKWLYAQPLQSYFAANIDPAKSKPHQLPNGRVENIEGLAYWIPTKEYIADMDMYLKLISKLKLVEYVVFDPSNDKPLIKFFVIQGRKAIWDGKLGNGMVAMQYNIEEVLAWRKRDDGLLGLESKSGMVDTRLSRSEALKEPKMFPEYVKKTTKAQADFSSVDGEFSKKRFEQKGSQLPDLNKKE